MKYRLIKREQINKTTTYAIEKRAWALFIPMWLFVDSSVHQVEMERLLERLRAGEPYETRTPIT